MHYFILANKDSYITEDSPSHIILYTDSKDRNYGGDEILELKKEFANPYSTSPTNVSRILTDFDLTSLSQLIANGEIDELGYSSSGSKCYLRYYEVEGQKELNKSYTLLCAMVRQAETWEEGVGKHFDNPKTTNGVTWTDYKSGSSWEIINSGLFDSGSRTGPGGGVWFRAKNYQSTQSFHNESADININITRIVDAHMAGDTDNHGMILKYSGSYENDETPLNLKFFSKNTHTIYAPKLEVKWDDSTHSTGTLNQLTMSGEIENHIFIKGLQPTYRESEKVRFRLGCRKKYVQRTFTNSIYSSSFYVPEGSGSYSIVDVATNTDIVPFSDYTKLSCDPTSMYFDQWLNAFEPGRYYKVLFKLKYNDGQEHIIDNDEEFKVI